MEHEQRNGHALPAGFDPENGELNGNSLTAHSSTTHNGHEAIGHGSVGANGSGLLPASASSAEISPLDRRLEYVDRSVGSAPIDDVRGIDGDDDFERMPRKSSARNNSRIVQQVGEARRRQGLSIRCVAQRLGLTVGEVRAKEEPDADMTLSELYRWQEVLEVPLEELLADPDDALSPRVLMRARMLRVMKTARALRAQARTESEHRLAKLLISQLIEIMPELKEVSAWPTVGHRRTADEMGRIAERPISDDFMHEAS